MSVEKIAGAILSPILNPLSRYAFNKNQKIQIIAESFQVSRERLGFVSNPPLACTMRVQRVMLRIDGCKMSIEGGGDKFFLEDGTIIKPEIQIIDQENKTYDLEGGQCFASPDTDSDLWTVSAIGFSFQEDQKCNGKLFTEVRIRNDKPFECLQMYWYDHNPK